MRITVTKETFWGRHGKKIANILGMLAFMFGYASGFLHAFFMKKKEEIEFQKIIDNLLTLKGIKRYQILLKLGRQNSLKFFLVILTQFLLSVQYLFVLKSRRNVSLLYLTCFTKCRRLLMMRVKQCSREL
ncbi:Oidioi.mRNA.OKI2018_I69.PAR.g8770.t1.cds [Oikopleura dioica]|uniref:Oidioi.mRNA.OKI2018_I69.PAR.g8770.t1.cds n=1 Tax=Oikopleura dioica TaxID=34765 RepID=A0ABN7RLI0_OIKDI|nr:Oidioi.mRNA.OKI2018_I69.PAR.g8770.t1.cds [Oikopleura dioica]